MPRLCFVADLHGEIDRAFTVLDRWQERNGKKIDACVQVGDLNVSYFPDFYDYWQGKKQAPLPLYSILGNHDDYTIALEWQKQPDRIHNMHLIPDGSVVNVAGVQVAGLWGCFSPKSYADPARVQFHRGTQGNSDRIAGHIDANAVDRLMVHRDGFDVLVTHDASRETLHPRFLSQPKGSTKASLGLDQDEKLGGCSAIDRLIERHKPERYFFGHLHFNYFGKVGSCDYRCLNAIQYSDDFFEVVEF